MDWEFEYDMDWKLWFVITVSDLDSFQVSIFSDHLFVFWVIDFEQLRFVDLCQWHFHLLTSIDRFNYCVVRF